MKKEKLQKILESHKLWLAGGAGTRAHLSRADLGGVDLSGANLCDGYLAGADLSGADLSDADLAGAYLVGADLRGANLRNANLRGAVLNGAFLSGAYLRDADLAGADLSGADLCNANLRGADLHGVTYSEHTAFFALQCPEEGSFIAWKKCRNGVIVKLLIPEDAKRSSATTRKCRASKAIVIEVIGAEKAVSIYDGTFVYEVGKEIFPDTFDDNRWNECSHGIHFFITRKEAENY